MASMNFHKARFKAAYGTSAQLPAPTLPEVSFSGRSNVGKSSLLNALMYRKGLAKVSATPGKTATANFYEVDGAHLVDLPGYGYARASKAERARWVELIEGYFSQGRRIALAVTLVDIRHDAQRPDVEMIGFLREREVPILVAFTKADKLGKSKAANQAASLRRQLELSDDEGSVLTSAAASVGIEQLRRAIAAAV